MKKMLKIVAAAVLIGGLSVIGAGPALAGDAYSFGFSYSSGHRSHGQRYHGHHYRHYPRYHYSYSYSYCPPPVVYYSPPPVYYAPPPPVYYYSGGVFYCR